MRGSPSTSAQPCRARRIAALATSLVLLGVVAGASAFYSASGSGTASARIGAIAPPSNVATKQTGADVAISWNAATLSSGAGVQGYTVARSGGPTVCGVPTLVVGLSCTDTNVPGGSYAYTVTAVYHTFTATAASASISVLNVPTITASPSDPSASGTPAFSFTGGGGSGYECRLDGGLVTACSSPRSYSAIAAGSHTFMVRATRDAAAGPFASHAWTIDASAPSITAKPSDPSFTASPAFSFAHGQASYAFNCKLDGGPFSACTSPRSYAGVADGLHTFQVQALGADGATTPSTSYTWRLDTTAPTMSWQPSGGLVWANGGTNSIGRANLDGTGVNQSLVTGAGSPRGVAADGSYVYWTNTLFGAYSIGRARLDGSSANQSFIAANYVWAVGVDSSRVYWTNTGNNTIGRANLDGTSPNPSFITGASGPVSVALTASHVYWANISTKTIGRANLDGSSPNHSFIALANAAQGLAVNDTHIYWGTTATNSIGRANLDGTSPNPSFITGASGPQSVAVDDSRVYWGNFSTIGRANLDGSSVNQSFITGASSPRALAVVPAQSGGSFLSADRLYYNGNAAGSVTLSATVADTGSGPASATFPAIATTGWSHAAETVTTGSGSAPAITYAASAFSWTASPANPIGYGVTSTDAAGNTSSPSPLTFVNDSGAPTGGALSVNGTAATAAGSTSTTSPGASFTIGSRSDYGESQSETQSGLKASTLTVRSASLAAGTCGAPGSAGPFTAPVTVTGTTQPAGVVSGFCYVYTLSGGDRVANSTAISTTVQAPA